MNAFNISDWSEELDDMLSDDNEVSEGYYYSDYLRSIPKNFSYVEEKPPEFVEAD